MKHLAWIAGCALALAAGTAFADDGPAAGASPLGRWITASGNLEVELAPCGEALCGAVVRVLANHSMSREGGEMKPADARDPLGMQVLHDFVPTGFTQADGERVANEWRGFIYNRENAKTYRCLMTLGPAGELLLRGYVGLPLFGSTSIWRRAVVSIGAH